MVSTQSFKNMLVLGNRDGAVSCGLFLRILERMSAHSRESMMTEISCYILVQFGAPVILARIQLSECE